MANSFPNHGDLAGWTEFLKSGPLPVLSSTSFELQNLLSKGDGLLPGDLSVTVLRDPLFAALVLRHMRDNKNRLRRVDITTIEHALMMLGVKPFYEHFGGVTTIEAALGGHLAPIQATRGVARRGYVASRLAQDWAAKAKDIESEELQVAALIHDIAEMLLWIHAPGHAFLIGKKMHEQPTLRSRDAQQLVLGVALVDVEIGVLSSWGVPDLLLELLRGSEESSRMAMVRLAIQLARHSAQGWNNAALPDDWEAIAKLLGKTTPEAAQEEIKPYVDELGATWDAHNRESLA